MDGQYKCKASTISWVVFLFGLFWGSRILPYGFGVCLVLLETGGIWLAYHMSLCPTHIIHLISEKQSTDVTVTLLGALLVLALLNRREHQNKKLDFSFGFRWSERRLRRRSGQTVGARFPSQRRISVLKRFSDASVHKWHMLISQNWPISLASWRNQSSRFLSSTKNYFSAPLTWWLSTTCQRLNEVERGDWRPTFRMFWYFYDRRKRTFTWLLIESCPLRAWRRQVCHWDQTAGE